MQMVFQDPYASLNPRMTVADIIGEPLRFHGLAATGAETREQVAELLSTVGLNPKAAQRYPHEFSGGQRQRISIARALAVQPDFIIADEPISALDVNIQAQIINLMLELQEKFGLTYLFIAHDLAVVRHISDRIVVLYLGKVVEIAPADDALRAPAAPLHALPDLGGADARCRRRAPAAAPASSRASRRARSTRRPAAASAPAARSRKPVCAEVPPPLAEHEAGPFRGLPFRRASSEPDGGAVHAARHG